MRTRQPEGPYLLAGFSSGGIVAFEMAQQVRADGQEVAVLALLDTFAPGARLRNNRWRRAKQLLRLEGFRGEQERLYYVVNPPSGGTSRVF